mmetsp:Transcript_64606/g.203947  ORF Transcript_64606/g.203947 Transcript_64606/m.203947 type:complete len:294 (-) Transcript_64606:88-969(-)
MGARGRAYAYSAAFPAREAVCAGVRRATTEEVPCLRRVMRAPRRAASSTSLPRTPSARDIDASSRTAASTTVSSPEDATRRARTDVASAELAIPARKSLCLAHRASTPMALGPTAGAASSTSLSSRGSPPEESACLAKSAACASSIVRFTKHPSTAAARSTAEARAAPSAEARPEGPARDPRSAISPTTTRSDSSSSAPRRAASAARLPSAPAAAARVRCSAAPSWPARRPTTLEAPPSLRGGFRVEGAELGLIDGVPRWRCPLQRGREIPNANEQRVPREGGALARRGGRGV